MTVSDLGYNLVVSTQLVILSPLECVLWEASLLLSFSIARWQQTSWFCRSGSLTSSLVWAGRWGTERWLTIWRRKFSFTSHTMREWCYWIEAEKVVVTSVPSKETEVNSEKMWGLSCSHCVHHRSASAEYTVVLTGGDTTHMMPGRQWS